MAAGHALGVEANWTMQLTLDIYKEHPELLDCEGQGRPAVMDCKELKRLSKKTAANKT